MSLLNDASLILVPSAIKTGEVLVQKPLPNKFADETGNYDGNDPQGSANLTFSRASSATRVGLDGLIQRVRTNVLLQSNTFNTTWATTNASVTSGQSGYDGTNNAWELNSSASGGRILQSNTQAGLQTFSAYAKGSVSSGIRLYAFGTVNANAYFNLNLGTVGAIGGSGVTAKIEAVGGGWYRCSISFNQTNVNVRLYTSDNANAEAAGTIYIQNAQLETADIATQPILTTTAAVSVGPVSGLPRLDYLGSSCPRLILEPQSTSLILFSEQMDNAAWTKANLSVTANQTASPTGYSDADSLAEQAVSGIHYTGQGITSAAAGTYTFSCFLKQGTTQYGGFRAVVNGFTNRYFVLLDLSNGSVVNTNTTASGVTWTHKVDNYGNGWYRLSVTAAHTSGNIDISISTSDTATPTYFGGLPTYLGTNKFIYAWGANITATAYPQSYIPTLGSTVTRLADSASKTGTGISSLIGQTEGTLFFDIQDTEHFLSYFGVDNASTGTRILVYGVADQKVYTQVRNGGTVLFSGSSAAISGRAKAAVSFNASGSVFYVNGTQVASGSGTTYTNLSQFTLNHASQVGSSLNQALLFKTRLSNAKLAELTTL
jgi:hypothetical protein